jgi:hypothetical protein
MSIGHGRSFIGLFCAGHPVIKQTGARLNRQSCAAAFASPATAPQAAPPRQGVAFGVPYATASACASARLGRDMAAENISTLGGAVPIFKNIIIFKYMSSIASHAYLAFRPETDRFPQGIWLRAPKLRVSCIPDREDEAAKNRLLDTIKGDPARGPKEMPP